MKLAQKKCIPCEVGAVPLTRDEAEELLQQTVGWELDAEGKVISKKFKFKNFEDALAFVNKVGALAEEEGHHPDISLGWGAVTTNLTTHKIQGLSENDFILAAKINELR